ncbi:hypothetical protein CYY_001626 [Polysphondylium violaceum]|uniref:Uncharacterized protein n=1 Tax=Polysphondylium violaceum TaxID=133409 RepID=A0A8J4Q1H6_9MYCE|nr:hypothetical protein CYY_001626 [Polysphondylium violaceum]
MIDNQVAIKEDKHLLFRKDDDFVYYSPDIKVNDNVSVNCSDQDSSGSNDSIASSDLSKDETLGIYYGKKRFLIILLGMIQILCVSGIVFGWSPLEQIMVQQKAFIYLCEPNQPSCEKQSLRLNLVYLVGSFTSTGSAFISGSFFDRYGPKLTNLCSFTIMILGCVLWEIAYKFENNLYILSFALIGIGGPASQVSLLHLNNLFPKYKDGISTAFSGMFVGSSFVFKLFNIIGSKYNISISYIFLVYAAILSVVFIPSILLMRNKPFLPIEDLLMAQKKQQSNDTESNNEKSIEVEETVKEKPLLKQLLSWQFILLSLFMSLNSLHEVFYLGIINTNLANHPTYINIFNYIWNGGILMVPIIGYMIQKSSIHMNSFYVNLAVTFVFVSFQNVYLWAFFFTYLSDVFGYNNYGKIMGSVSIITALVGLLEYLFVYLSFQINFVWINMSLTLVKVPLFLLTFKLWRFSQKEKQLLENNKNKGYSSIN